jgi:hypothetical protein
MAIDPKDFYLIWEGSLNLGDTAGVFNNAQFAGLILQTPIEITYPPAQDALFLFRTTDVEIYGGKTHPVYWDWLPGTPFGSPVGQIDDADPVSGKPEYHLITIPNSVATKTTHTFTTVVNVDVPARMKDDFVLQWIGANSDFGAKIGW